MLELSLSLDVQRLTRRLGGKTAQFIVRANSKSLVEPPWAIMAYISP